MDLRLVTSSAINQSKEVYLAYNWSGSWLSSVVFKFFQISVQFRSRFGTKFATFPKPQSSFRRSAGRSYGYLKVPHQNWNRTKRNGRIFAINQLQRMIRDT